MESHILAMHTLSHRGLHTGEHYKRLCVRRSGKGEGDERGQAIEKIKQKSSQQPMEEIRCSCLIRSLWPLVQD